MKLSKGKLSGLRYFTSENVVMWESSLSRYFPDTWKGTAIDILNRESIPFEERLRAILRSEICSDKLMRLFAVFCFRDTLSWIHNPHDKSVNAASVAKKHANGEATDEELHAAWLVADAAWLIGETGWSAVAWSDPTSSVSAWSAAWSIRYSAEAAAYAAVESAQFAALYSAQFALKSARYASNPEAQDRYKKKLIKMLKTEGKALINSQE